MPVQYKEYVHFTGDIIKYMYMGGGGGVFSTTGDTMMSVGGFYECTKACSVHRRDTMMSMMGYHEYTGVSRQIQLFPQ